MAITVGTDTYLTVASADTYVEANYICSDTKYSTWDALSDATKEIYLKRATKKLDRQYLRGVKAVSSQTLEFPRAIRTEYRRDNFPLINITLDNDWVIETSVNQMVIDAQVEEAITLATSSATAGKRAELQAQGVKSFSLGNLSEDYGAGETSATGSTKLLSIDAQELLRYYVVGSVAL